MKYSVLIYDSFESIPQVELKQLLGLYQEVFGECGEELGSVWGEGAYCSKEGKRKKISLKEYRSREVQNKLACECGGLYVQYHTEKEIMASLKESFAGPGVDRCRLCLLKDECSDLVGFSWGSLRTTESALSKLSGSYTGELTKNEENLIKKAIDSNLILFFEEIGISKGHRGSSSNLFALTSPILSMTVEKRVKPMIFRTYKKTKVFSFARRIGFRVILDKEDKPILYVKNVLRIFLWLQILGPKTIKKVLKLANPVQ